MTVDAQVLLSLPEPDASAAAVVRNRAERVLRPSGALAQLDEAAVWLAGWQRTTNPGVRRPCAVAFAADHGVAANAVSAYPAHVTAAMLDALRAGTATLCALARAEQVALTVVDVGVGRPTGDITIEDALDRRRFDEAWSAGESAVAGLDADVVVFGEMGIGNTTAASAVVAALFGGDVAGWVGRGTGVDDSGLARKIAAVETAAGRARGLAPLEVLRVCGGAELVALAAGILTARCRSLPVVLDGFVVTAAAAVLHAVNPAALDHTIAGHRSPEPGHTRLLEQLGKRPLLDLGLRLGEGSGALLALPLVRLAAAAVVDVATFEEAGLA